MPVRKTPSALINAPVLSANVKKASKKKLENASQNAMKINAKKIHMLAGRIRSAKTCAKDIGANAWMDSYQMKIH